MPKNEIVTEGIVVSVTNPLPTTPGTGVTFDVSDRAARDLGKVDVAGIDAVGTIAGQKAMAASIPVVVASDQSDVEVKQDTHDNLLCNATLQVGDADVVNGNPVPVSDAGGAISIDIGGVAPGLDNTNKVGVSLYGKSSAAGDTEVSVDASGNVQVDIVASIPAGTSNIGDVDVLTMPKGSVTTAHDGISATATSAEIPCLGHNGVILHLEGTLEASQTWAVEVLGCATTGGTFGKGYYQSFEQKITINDTDLTTDGVVNFTCPGTNNYIKIRATLSGGTATLTVKVTPVNL